MFHGVRTGVTYEYTIYDGGLKVMPCFITFLISNTIFIYGAFYY